VPFALAEEMGVKYSRDFEKVINAALRKIGFDKVYLTGVGNDILITELAKAVEAAPENTEHNPIYVSACPAWVKYCEQFLPELMPSLSTLKTPQQISGAIIKTILTGSEMKGAGRVFTASVTPCTAMKFEARRDSMTRKGVSDVDTVLTVRELARLIGLYGIDISNIDPEPADEPLSSRSSIALLTQTSGGIAEAVLRTVSHNLTGRDMDRAPFKKLRLANGFREMSVTISGRAFTVAVADGIKSLERLRESLENGARYDLIEVMACPGGCVNGAGMIPAGSKEAVRMRSRFIYQSDEQDPVTGPWRSHSLTDMYEKIIPGNDELSDKRVLNTFFVRRDVLL